METSDSRLTEHRHLLSKCRSQEKKSHSQRQEGCINEYIHGNNPQKKVLKVRKYHYLYNVSAPMIWNGHIDESVFALSLKRNLTVSMNTRMTTTPFHLYSFACSPHSTIQVWGLFLFTCIRVLSEPLFR